MMDWLVALFWPAHTGAVAWVTDWGGPLGWLIAIHLVFYLLGVRQGVYVAAIAIASLLLNSWLKSLIMLPRPYFLSAEVLVHRPTPGLGMPSGHAQGAAAVSMAIAKLVRPQRLWLVVALLFALAVGLSRVILGVHSMSQVLVGWGLGLASVWLGSQLLPVLLGWFTQRRVSVVLGWVVLVVVAGVLTTLAINWLRADFVVPSLWQQNYLRAGPNAEPLTTEALLAANAAYALLSAAVGVALVGCIQRSAPVFAKSIEARLVCLVVGALVTALLWWLATVSRWLQSPVALTLPLVYPLICGYLPVAITHRLTRHEGQGVND